jgi:hypothetical protein
MLVLSLVLVRTGLLSEFSTPVEYALLLLGGSIFASIGFIVFRLRVWTAGMGAFFKARPASQKESPSPYFVLLDSVASFIRIVVVGVTVVVTTLEYYDRHDLAVQAIGWMGLFALGFLIGRFRIAIYLFELLVQLALSTWVRWHPEKSLPLLRLSPVYWDEESPIPLIGLDTLLVEVCKQSNQTGHDAIAYVSQFPSQQLAARDALIELTADDVEHAKNLRAIANIVERFAWLPLPMPQDLENVLPPIRDIAAYAQAALESDTHYNKKAQLRSAILQTQKVREGLGFSKNRQIAARFGPALEPWEQVLGKELSGLNARETIPNVYVVGSPLASSSKVFKGRRDLFVALELELASQAEQRPTLLLFGARRSGKTSAIKQLPVRLGPDVIPVDVDLQSAATAEDVSGLLFGIADQIKSKTQAYRRVQLPTLTRDDLRTDPYVVFGDWLNRVEEDVGTRWILLSLGEYERLTEMMDAGRLDKRVLDFLRSIIQHHLRVTVLLSGSHTLEDLPPIWSDYLINVRVLKIENLKEDEARELIVKPMDDFPLQYEPVAVERILAVTGCQPFLLQATCRDLINLLNDQARMLATLADVDCALDSVLTTGVAYFQELWGGRDGDDVQRAVMRAIATRGDLTGLEDLSGLDNAVHKLIHRDILVASGSAYCFRVELVRRWIERKSMAESSPAGVKQVTSDEMGSKLREMGREVLDEGRAAGDE